MIKDHRYISRREKELSTPSVFVSYSFNAQAFYVFDAVVLGLFDSLLGGGFKLRKLLTPWHQGKIHRNRGVKELLSRRYVFPALARSSVVAGLSLARQSSYIAFGCFHRH